MAHTQKLTLREENYSIPVGRQTAQRRKRKMSRGGPYGYRFKQRSDGTGTYQTTTEFIEDNSRLNHRRGDIVKFGNQHYLPKILKEEFGVVLDRYKMTRHKGCEYVDYYAVIMLITGPNKGEVFKRNSMHGGFSKVNF